MSRHEMIHHEMPPPRAAGSEIGADILLDQCRRLAGLRMTGSIEQADRALAALRARLPLEEAYRVFGLLYDLVGTLARGPEAPFRWHPTGALWRTRDEEWLVIHALAPLIAGRAEAAERQAIMALAESYCLAADRLCGLAAAPGEACRGPCPFTQGRILLSE
ncbi:MAG: hypothetical protein LDL22_03090 [Hyphomicrobiales bacterium]|nr:hypothetical protein [Hyphomicrobiales bacterium]